MGVEVRPVASRRDIGEFIELPFRLHSSFEQWVPPVRLERHAHLSRRFNAFFRHGDARLFLARRAGRVVGRISAQIDHNFNAHHANAWGHFGFLELEDDPEVARGLFEAAAGWLRARGCDRMVGPCDFTMNDEAGVLVEGFELPPMIRQPWHPPHYRALCEDAGLRKAVDLFMWSLEIADRAVIKPVIFELAERVGPRHAITLRKMSRRSLRRDLDAFAEVYNAAWKDNWGFVPYTKADLDAYHQELQLVFDPHWFMVAERAPAGGGAPETVGVAITVPDINQVLRRTRGRLLPLGWWHLLRKSATVDRVRVGFLGVKPEFQHTGVAAKMYVEHFDMAAVTPQKSGEMGWILETNRNMNKGMEAMGGRIVKRFRVFEREL